MGVSGETIRRRWREKDPEIVKHPFRKKGAIWRYQPAATDSQESPDPRKRGAALVGVA